MRKKEVNGPLSVQAIAGTHVVLLGMSMPQDKCPGLLGFAIRREDKTEGETYWLKGYKTFESVEPHPTRGVAYSTDRHPIQGFSWSDFSAKPGHEYAFEIFALRGKPASPEKSESVRVAVRTETESIPGSHHHVHFNRGAAASQEYIRRFGDRSPADVGPAAFKWLSRGASEAIQAFIARADAAGRGLRVAAYEFTDDEVLGRLKALWKNKRDVRVLYHAKNDAQRKANEAQIAAFGMAKICIPRAAKGISLAHNKFIVLTENGAALAVLTGSTNFSQGGIYGHSNVVHICEDPKIAAEYLWLWDRLSQNEDKKVAAPVIGARSPLPHVPLQPGTSVVFSPRTDPTALQWYAARAKEAENALFMTFAFGMHQLFQDAYRNGTAKLRYALMEKMSGPTKTDAQRKANEATIIALRKMEANKFAIGSYLGKGSFDRWLKERLSGLNANVRYLHTKYMLVDPLGREPLVVSGSANFSEASTLDNDENMLVISTDTRVADIYLGEFMRMYNHFAFREWLSTHTDEEGSEVSHLDEKDTWWRRYFGDTFASRQREYFAGETAS